VCGNGLEVPMDLANHAVLEAFDRLLTPAVFEKALDAAIAQLTACPENAASRRGDLEGRLAALTAEAARLTEALAAGGDLTPLVAAQRTRDAQGGVAG
jgi:hypothetical protein